MDWLGKLPWTLQHPREGIELVQCSTAGTKTTLFLLNPRFYYRPYSPFQCPGIDLPGEAEKCDLPVVGTHPPVPLLEERDHHPDLPPQRYCPRPPRDVAETWQPRQPHNIQRLKVLRADLIHSRCLATEEFLDYLGDFSPGDGRGHLRAPSLCFLNRRRDGGIEEILEVFLPPSDDIPSWGQQPPTSTVNSVGGALLPPPEAPDGLPESLRGQPVVLLHGLTELLPSPSFCLHNHPGCTPLSLPVPVSCLRSPTSQPGPIGLLLQLDGVPYFRCPPPGSGIAASTGTGDLTATAPRGLVDNGGGEHGPLWLNISNLPRDPVEALPEVGVEDLSDRGFGQTFPADPYSTLGSAESVQPPLPPSVPTHHQVVIIHPSLHPSVQDIRPKVRWNDHKVDHRPTA